MRSGWNTVTDGNFNFDCHSNGNLDGNSVTIAELFSDPRIDHRCVGQRQCELAVCFWYTNRTIEQECYRKHMCRTEDMPPV